MTGDGCLLQEEIQRRVSGSLDLQFLKLTDHKAFEHRGNGKCGQFFQQKGPLKFYF